MKKPSAHSDLLIIASSETDANLYYATRFLAPDPFIFFRIRGKKYLLMNDLEVDRARKYAHADAILSASKLSLQYEKRHGNKPTRLDLVKEFAAQKGIRSLFVPSDFPLGHADWLRKKGLRIRVKPEPFFEGRPVKTRDEIRAIARAIRGVERAMEAAIELLKKSSIRRGKLYSQGGLLTSELLKQTIRCRLMENHLTANRLIVACGRHTVDPHDEGTGPLYANRPIIFDIFPQDSESRYFADFTRTVVRGKASPKLKRMFAAVKEAQETAFASIRDGADAGKIHQTILARFKDLGFPTGVIGNRRQGFFHGTGHGLGLQIHEPPNLGARQEILKTGHVVTVEPGLYYEDTGGVRLEDVVAVTQTGCVNLTRFPKFLEI